MTFLPILLKHCVHAYVRVKVGISDHTVVNLIPPVKYYASSVPWKHPGSHLDLTSGSFN